MAKKSSVINNSLSHLIAEKITQQIIIGELKPGEKIIEADYAEEFGTSRAPIRESLYQLATEGLIERIPRKGAVVKGYNEVEIYDILEIRRSLEGLALERVKTYGPCEHILKDLENLVCKMKEVALNKNEYANLNKEFHLKIIELSGSTIMKDMYKRLGKPLVTLQRISLLEEDHIRKSLEEHIAIIELLKDHLFDEAREILERHNEAVLTRVRQKLFPKKENAVK
ncbi:GntR family transcriptional regulator [bacterium LRH843]|nr:GntR family transcriptional regulator [bacterium LRH843]